MYTSICQEYRGIKAPDQQGFERGMNESYHESSSSSSGLAPVKAELVVQAKPSVEGTKGLTNAKAYSHQIANEVIKTDRLLTAGLRRGKSVMSCRLTSVG